MKKVKKTKKVRSKLENTHDVSKNIISTEKKVKTNNSLNFVIKLLTIAIIGLALFLVAKKYRNLIVAGSVNSKPIYRYQLNSKMSEQYGKATFDRIVDELLITDQAKKNGIEVVESEIADEVANTVEGIGGEEAFKNALSSSGMTEAGYKEMVKLQLMVKKLSEKLFPTEVSDEEIATYYEENKEYLGEKTLDEVKEQLMDQLLQQKTGEKLTEWFDKIKAEAKIESLI